MKGTPKLWVPAVLFCALGVAILMAQSSQKQPINFSDLGAKPVQGAQTRPKPADLSAGLVPKQPVVGDLGRYQIVMNPNVRADTFLLDTETGKTWVH